MLRDQQKQKVLAKLTNARNELEEALTCLSWQPDVTL
jgi:hypothetical protein